MLEIANAIERLAKGSENSAQGYTYLSEADAVAALRKELVQRGILVFPHHSTRHVEVIHKDGGKFTALTTIDTEWEFTDGEQTISISTIGQGTDTGDKGAYKAMTGARKYGLLHAFLIATGDDAEIARADEIDAETNSDKATPAQKSQLASAAKTVKSFYDGETFSSAKLQAFVKDVTGKEQSSDLTKSDMELIFQAIAVAQQTGGDLTSTPAKETTNA